VGALRQVIGLDGDVLTITGDTAGKARFRNYVTLPNGLKRPMTDTEFAAKLRAEAHIDVLGQTSRRGSRTVSVSDKLKSFLEFYNIFKSHTHS
jgi:hypothetical protein